MSCRISNVARRTNSSPGSSTEARDRYMPHCDGDCAGGKYHPGGRVATMLMYCATPDLGGNTNFRKANVQVKPVAGSATWFTYAR